MIPSKKWALSSAIVIVVLAGVGQLLMMWPSDPPAPDGARSLTALRWALLNSDAVRQPTPGQKLIDELVLHGTSAVPVLAKAVANDDPDIRFHALSALYRLGPDAADATPALIEALHRRDVDTYGTAKGVLIRIGSSAVEPVKAAVASTTGRPQLTAAEALARLGQIEHGLPPLQAALAGKSQLMRYEAAGALGRIGPPAAAAADALRTLAQTDPLENIRSAATTALKRIEPPPPSAPASSPAIPMAAETAPAEF